MSFTPSNWYWIVGGSSTQVYSSVAGDYVPVSNPTYQAWLSSGHVPTAIDTEANLGGVLAVYNARPVNANVLTAYQNAAAASLSAVNQAQFQVLFNHENRIRTLEGKGTITAPQFINGIAALL